MRYTIIALAALLFALGAAPAQAQTRKELLDEGWLFTLQDPAGAEQTKHNTSTWRSVDLPHDWDITHKPNAYSAMGNDGGYYAGGVAWYRREFKTPPGVKLKLHFEGVYQQCRVYVNGQLVGTHNYGYTPFWVDITSAAKKEGQTNVVAVRVDNSTQPNCRWYSGSGIYRHVWLESYTPGWMDDPQKLQLITEDIRGISGGKAKEAVIKIVYDGKEVGTRTLQDVTLWTPQTPKLYTIEVGRLKIPYGIRKVEYSAERGMLLNGKPVVVNGACIHHDNGILGAAAFDAAEIRKVRLMKEAGFNLIRTAHNPPSQAFLDACDSLGMLVIDEAFDGWYSEKTRGDYHLHIAEDHQADLEAMVRRDRNHACVVAWSIGNEVIERKEIRVVWAAQEFTRIVRALDPTRPVTEALCSWDSDWEIFDPHADILDIVGYNYMIHKHESDHRRKPERVMWQTESYPREAFSNWKLTNSYPYIIGDIVWTGLDYLGESGIGQTYHPGEPDGEHYTGKHFPYHGAYCGDVDITGYRKPISHYRSILWNADERLFLAVREPDQYQGGVSMTKWATWPTQESWTWKGWEGKPIEVEVYTRAPQVRLLLNGREVASAKVSEETEYRAVMPVTYEPGMLVAEAVDAAGQVVAKSTLRTAGSAASIRLTPDRSEIEANGQDVAFFTVEVLDANGVIAPHQNVYIEFRASGDGEIIGAGSANMRDLEPLASSYVTTWHGRALVAVRAGKSGGSVTLTAISHLPTAKATVKTSK